MMKKKNIRNIYILIIFFGVVLIPNNVYALDYSTRCVEVFGNPSNSNSLAWLMQRLFDYTKILGPILVIMLSSIDFTKTIMTGDQESMKKAQNNLFVRVLCAAGLFLLPILVTIMINLVFGADITKPICGIK